MKRSWFRGGAAAGLLLMLAACSPGIVPDIVPTQEPVLPPISQATAAPTLSAAPTATPVPLAGGAPSGTAGPATSGTPSAFLPLVGAGTTGCPGASPNGARLPDQRFGINLVPGAQPIEQLLDSAKAMSAGWVRTTVRWSDMEPQQGSYQWSALDALLNGAKARDLHLLLVVTQSPAWVGTGGGMPKDPAQFGTFMDALVRHAPGLVSAYEIWDAPNTAAANAGTVADPKAYAAVLVAAHDAIKAVDRCALVLNGSLFPTAERDPKTAMDDLGFYRGIVQYQNGAGSKAFDILATQLNTTASPPNTGWKFGQQAESRKYYGHATILRDEMTADGEGNKHLWITSIGYETSGAQAVKPDQQSAYLRQVFERSETFYPWISGIFVRDLGGDPSAKTSYDLLNADGTPRPAYGVLHDYFTKQRAAIQQDVSFPNTGLAQLWEQRFPATEQLVLGPDGAIYGGNGRGFINGIDPNGAFRRNERISSKDVVGVAFDQQGNAYMAAKDGVLVSSTAGGELRWSVLIDGAAATTLLLSADGQTLYAGTGAEHLAAINTSDGTPRWSATLGGGIPGTPALGSDGTVYIGTTEGKVFAVAPDGTVRWNADVGSWVHVAPVAAGDVIYAATDRGVLLALNADGSQRWSTELGAQGPQGIALASDGTVYVSTADSTLQAIGPDGAKRWGRPLGGEKPTAPVVAQDGRIVIGSVDGGFRLVSADGAQQETFQFRQQITAAPVIGRDGAIYLSLKGKKDQDYLVAFGPSALRDQYRVAS